MKPDLKIKIGKLECANPVWVASGTFGYAKEFEKFISLKKLGAIVTKTLTLKPRTGNPPQRVYETPGGMLNAIGLQNVGVEAFVRDKLPYLKAIGVPVIASVMGYSVKEFADVVEALDAQKAIDGFELNLSCPNVKYDQAKPPSSASDRPARMFAHDAGMIAEVVSAARKITRKTLIAKLGPDVSDIGRMALAAEKSGADAVSLINTFVAMAINVKTRRPYIRNVTGGLSGPCVRPIAVRLVWEAKKSVSIPVIGMGGIMNANDALEFLIAGAAAVQVGTANFVNPRATMDVLEGLEDFLKSQKIAKVTDLVDTLKTQ